MEVIVVLVITLDTMQLVRETGELLVERLERAQEPHRRRIGPPDSFARREECGARRMRDDVIGRDEIGELCERDPISPTADELLMRDERCQHLLRDCDCCLARET